MESKASIRWHKLPTGRMQNERHRLCWFRLCSCSELKLDSVHSTCMSSTKHLHMLAYFREKGKSSSIQRTLRLDRSNTINAAEKLCDKGPILFIYIHCLTTSESRMHNTRSPHTPQLLGHSD
jgi:hypothetical protein